MQIDILDIKGKKTGRVVELPEEIFGIEPNDHAIYLSIKQYLASQRQGTNKVKTRAEVQGASRKLHKQKGTGGSRKGNIRNPLYKGGGTVFGPKPRDYNFKLNKKVKDLAKTSALSHKAKEKALVIIEDIVFEKPKTKQFASVLNTLKIDNKKVLFVGASYDSNLCLSVRNMPYVENVLLSDMNTYNIMNANVLLLTESAAKVFVEAEELVVAEA